MKSCHMLTWTFSFHSYKSGTTLDAETDDSGLLTVHVYYNGLIPSELTLDTSELQRSFIFLLAVDVDQARALQDFNDGRLTKLSHLTYVAFNPADF